MNNIQEWVEAATGAELELRQAIHTVLEGISSQDSLRMEMIMKGGALMAIRYHTKRHTRDLDFSTTKHYLEFKESQENMIVSLEGAIVEASAIIDYGMAFVVQKVEVKPKGDDKNYQTLHIKIGYAKRSNKNEMTKFQAKQCAKVVEIDYSFNEIISHIDVLAIDEESGQTLKTYGDVTLVAEKLRAILQQKDKGKTRRQDIFDLHHFISSNEIDIQKSKNILLELLVKAKSRDLVVTRDSMADGEIYERSKTDYETLRDEIEVELPDFDKAYGVVRGFYESMPWGEIAENHVEDVT